MVGPTSRNLHDGFWVFIFLVVSLLCGCQTLFRDDEAPLIVTSIPRASDPGFRASDFVNRTQDMAPADREGEILKNLRRGNIPNFLRKMVPVHFVMGTSRGNVAAIIWVMPDYLAIGNDSSWMRIPMSPITAQRIADHFGLVLPTPKIVDLIYQNSTIKLEPQNLPPGPAMTSMDYILRHHLMVQSQLANKFGFGSKLVAGHKKDIVLTNELLSKRRRVAIYGWHRLSGQPIQPLSLVHGERYLDYSHGVRLVANTMLVNGKPMPIEEVLTDSWLAQLISYEGPLQVTRQPTDHDLM